MLFLHWQFTLTFVCSGCQNKVPQTGMALKQQKLFPSNCGDWKFEVKVSAGLASPGASVLSLEFMSSPGVFPQSVTVSKSPLHIRIVIVVQGPP